MNRPTHTAHAEGPTLRWLRRSLAFVWLWTAFVSLWEWHGQSMALLAQLPDALAPLKPALIGTGALADALIGLWLLWRPGRAAYLTALMMMVLMTVLATWIDPAWWLHPFGPLAKNVPLAAALLVLWHSARPSH